MFETFFDSKVDLWERQLRLHSSRLKNAATELIPKGLRTPRQLATLLPGDRQYRDGERKRERLGRTTSDEIVGDEGDEYGEGDGGERSRARKYRRDVEKEVDRIRVRVNARVQEFSRRWRSDQIVRTREKICEP